jgi:rod shape-determining protein MreD
MRNRNVATSLALVVTAVVLQSALFGESRIQPFGVSPNLVLVVVAGTARYLDPEPALLVGFTGGLLMDLLGGSPLGLWAMSLTVVAHLTYRFRDRAGEGPVVAAGGIFALTLIGHALFGIVGTLFGQKFFTDPGVLRLMVVPAAYSVVLAAAVLPLTTRLLRARSPRGWVA